MPKFQTEKNAHGWTLIIPTDLAWVEVVVVHLSYSSACTKTGSGSLLQYYKQQCATGRNRKKVASRVTQQKFPNSCLLAHTDEFSEVQGDRRESLSCSY